MAPTLTSPTDPLEVLCDQAVASIRRHVTVVRSRLAEWDLPEWDSTPPHGTRRPRPWGNR